MQLVILESSAESIRAGYECPCGCRPSVLYERAGAAVHDGCCCGNEFAVGQTGSPSLDSKTDYRLETESFRAPWGDPLVAAWLVGPSVHAGESHEHHHHDEADGHSHSQDGHEPVAAELDPVCGMSVDATAASSKGLSSTHKGHDYYFCGRGCKLDFDEDPDRYLDPAYIPSM